MAATYAAWNNLNTVIAMPTKQILKQTFEKFQSLFPEKKIGLVGDGNMELSEDITISTFQSLEKCSLEKTQLLLMDEVQCATGDKIQKVLTSIRPLRAFGYSATDRGFFNGADKLLKAFFGERLLHIDYPEAEADGAVVPGLVYMLRTPECLMDYKTIEAKIRHGIKTYTPRNALVGAVAKSIPPNWQTIIFVDTVADHLIELFGVCPIGTRYLHRNSDKGTAGKFALSPKQQNEIVDDFAANKFQFLIATDCFRAGADIPNVRVVIQASGGASTVEVLQEAYRGSRTLPESRRIELGVEPKEFFVVVDFQDNHDEVLQNMARKRKELYAKQGWQVVEISSPSEIKWTGSKKKTL